MAHTYRTPSLDHSTLQFLPDAELFAALGRLAITKVSSFSFGFWRFCGGVIFTIWSRGVFSVSSASFSMGVTPIPQSRSELFLESHVQFAEFLAEAGISFRCFLHEVQIKYYLSFFHTVPTVQEKDQGAA